MVTARPLLPATKATKGDGTENLFIVILDAFSVLVRSNIIGVTSSGSGGSGDNHTSRGQAISVTPPSSINSGQQGQIQVSVKNVGTAQDLLKVILYANGTAVGFQQANVVPNSFFNPTFSFTAGGAGVAVIKAEVYGRANGAFVLDDSMTANMIINP